MTQRPEDLRPAWEIAPDAVDNMIADYLRGESAYTVAARYNCSRTMPPLKAFKRGFIIQRCVVVSADIITPQGAAWLKQREEKTCAPSRKAPAR